MSTAEVVNTSELHVYERPLYSVSAILHLPGVLCLADCHGTVTLLLEFNVQLKCQRACHRSHAHTRLSLQAADRTPVPNSLLDTRLVILLMDFHLT